MQPISYVLPPYWGMQAIRHAALGGAVWGPIGMARRCSGSRPFAIAAVAPLRWFEHLARARATLSLT